MYVVDPQCVGQEIAKGPCFQDFITEDYVDTVFNMSLNPQIISEMRKTLGAQL